MIKFIPKKSMAVGLISMEKTEADFNKKYGKFPAIIFLVLLYFYKFFKKYHHLKIDSLLLRNMVAYNFVVMNSILSFPWCSFTFTHAN